MGSALPENNVAGDHELGGSFFGAESFTRALGGSVGTAFGSVRGGAPVVEWQEGTPSD